MQHNWLISLRKKVQNAISAVPKLQFMRFYDGPSDMSEMSRSPRSWARRVALQVGRAHCVWSFASSHGCNHSGKSAEPN